MGLAVDCGPAGWDDEFSAWHSALGDFHWAGEAFARGGSEIHAAVVYSPVNGEMFWAEKGVGAYVNDKRLRVSARRELKDALLRRVFPLPSARARSAWNLPAPWAR